MRNNFVFSAKKENKMTKPDLLPDEIYCRLHKGKAVFRSEPYQYDGAQTRYIRADLASTPNKSAEVDLDALDEEYKMLPDKATEQAIREMVYNFNRKYDNQQITSVQAEDIYRNLLWMSGKTLSKILSGHLDTGKGRGVIVHGGKIDAFMQKQQKTAETHTIGHIAEKIYEVCATCEKDTATNFIRGELGKQRAGARTNR